MKTNLELLREIAHPIYINEMAFEMVGLYEAEKVINKIIMQKDAIIAGLEQEIEGLHEMMAGEDL